MMETKLGVCEHPFDSLVPLQEEVLPVRCAACGATIAANVVHEILATEAWVLAENLLALSKPTDPAQAVARRWGGGELAGAWWSTSP